MDCDPSKKPAKYIRSFVFCWKTNQTEHREIGIGFKPLGPFVDVSLCFWNLRVGWVWYDVANRRGFYLGKNHNKLTTAFQ